MGVGRVESVPIVYNVNEYNCGDWILDWIGGCQANVSEDEKVEIAFEVLTFQSGLVCESTWFLGWKEGDLDEYKKWPRT